MSVIWQIMYGRCKICGQKCLYIMKETERKAGEEVFAIEGKIAYDREKEFSKEDPMKREKKRLLTVGAVLALSAMLAMPAAWGAPAVKSVRTSQTKDTVRIVADLSEKAAYSAYWQEEENDYIVRLENVDTSASLAAVKHSLLNKTEVIHGEDGALYLVFDLKEKASAKTILLDDPSRLVIDFTRDGSQPAFVAPAKMKADEKAAASTSSTAVGLVDVQDVRIYHGPDKVRTVFDMSGAASYETSYQKESGLLTLRMKNVSAAPRTIPAPKVGDVLKSVTISASGADTIVKVQMKPNSVCDVFALKGPDRIVVDVLKEYRTTKKIAGGVALTSSLTIEEDGCLTTHLAEVSPTADTAVRPVLAKGVIEGRETVSQMAKRTDSLLMVNGSYFAASGQILGLMKTGGQIVSTSRDGVRSCVGQKKDGSYLFGRADYEGIVTLPTGLKVVVSGVNCERGADMCVVYRPAFGARTATNVYGKEYIIKNGTVTAITDGNSPIEADSIVLSVHGKAAEAFGGVRVGNRITLDEMLTGEWNDAEWIVGAGPTLVADGQVCVTAQEEAFGSDVASGRAPRTAIGIRADGTLLLAVVEGRTKASRGMTLEELAAWLIKMGAVEAINLDGGGSSTICAGTVLVNRPSDGGERAVGNGIGVFRAK